MTGKTFITGPGRSGTTFLVQLLTRLGCDTGFVPYEEVVIDDWRAGCEWEIEIENYSRDNVIEAFKDSPRIIKGPVWAYLLKFLYIKELVKIDHVVMPLRDLTVSAYSRLGVGLDFLIDKDFIDVPGQHKEERQENILAMLTGKVLEACYVYRIPLTLMRFPRLVKDEEYCYRKVVDFERNINRERFGEIWRELARPDQINDFGPVEERVGYPA